MYAIKQNILPRGFFRPFRPRYQRANLRPGKFKKVLNNSLNKKDYLFFFFLCLGEFKTWRSNLQV